MSMAGVLSLDHARRSRLMDVPPEFPDGLICFLGRQIGQQFVDVALQGTDGRLADHPLLARLHKRCGQLWPCGPIAQAEMPHIDKRLGQAWRLLGHDMDAALGTHQMVIYRGVEQHRACGHSEQKCGNSRHDLNLQKTIRPG